MTGGFNITLIITLNIAHTDHGAEGAGDTLGKKVRGVRWGAKLNVASCPASWVLNMGPRQVRGKQAGGGSAECKLRSAGARGQLLNIRKQPHQYVTGPGSICKLVQGREAKVAATSRHIRSLCMPDPPNSNGGVDFSLAACPG